MQSIGERLEEARKRHGISIREAAEATKIRSDFLTYFEGDQFDFDLPDVYKVGFLKVYARYVGLDADKIGTDYRALRMGSQAARGRREGATGHTVPHFGSTSTRSGLGRMDLSGENPGEEAGAEAGGAAAAAAPVPEEEDELTRFDGGEGRQRLPIDELLSKFGGVGMYWKIALIGVAVLVLVVLTVLLISAFLSTDDTPADDPAATPPGQETLETEPFLLTVTADEPLRLIFPEANRIVQLEAGETMDPLSLDEVVKVIVDGDPSQALFEIDGQVIPIEVGADYAGRGSLYLSSLGLHNRQGELIRPLP